MKIFYSEDCNCSILNDKKIAVVGYGSQGKVFALNLRDSGCDITVALRSASRSIRIAESDGLTVCSPESLSQFDIIVLALPDHEHGQVYRNYLTEHGKQNRFLIFLHGLNVHFRNIDFLPTDDLILIAPHGPGVDLRQRYLNKTGLSCFFAIGKNSSGQAKEVGLAMAAAIGSAAAGIYETTFAAETIGDLFGEQALLVGGLAGLTLAVFDQLVAEGFDKHNAYIETAMQLKLLASLIEQHGPVGMMERVSKTALFGSLKAMPQLFDDAFRAKLKHLFDSINSGEFNRELQTKAQTEFAECNNDLAALRQHQCQKLFEELLKSAREKK